MNKPRAFCTFFDENYLFKGLAMLESLRRFSPESRVWILALTDGTFELLKKLNYPEVHLIRMSDFEDPELLRIKPTRSRAEYCWTLTPSLPLYVLKENPELDLVSYIDADCFFFSSPEPIFEEMGDRSVMIIAHRYTKDKMHLEKTNGRFNVGMVSFRNDPRGIQVLEWWRARCLEWCYARHEEGKFGDQKYLDAWPGKFEGVHELRHLGACVAPWNVEQYKIEEIGGTNTLINGDLLIFYHFHAFRLCSPEFIDPAEGYYGMGKKVINAIYTQYQAEFPGIVARVRAVSPGFSAGLEGPMPMFQRIKRKVLGMMT